MGRGRKQTDAVGWMTPGGGLPDQGPELNAAQQDCYQRLVKSMRLINVGGLSDLGIVCRTAKLWARLEAVESEVLAMPSLVIKNSAGVDCVHPLAIELDRLESKLRDHLCALYLTPRTRGAARLPQDFKESALRGGGGVDSDILKLMA